MSLARPIRYPGQQKSLEEVDDALSHEEELDFMDGLSKIRDAEHEALDDLSIILGGMALDFPEPQLA